MKRMLRVALVTSGGDCQGLNAAIRGIGKTLYEMSKYMGCMTVIAV